MKGKLIRIINAIEFAIGFVLFLAAQIEISTDTYYTWTRPYSSYESQTFLMKYVGLALMISGGIYFILKIYQARYTDSHIKDMGNNNATDTIIKCENCGLTVMQSTVNCPRCGKNIKPN